MICQNCNKNEANMHMKRIINGRAAEVHLCTDCARSLGYAEAFGGFGFGGLLTEILSKNEIGISTLRCSFCGKSFEEIAGDGKMGCAECYNVFYDKLLPSLNRIHGKASYEGAHPKGATSQSVLAELKSALQRAIEVQDFELAATLRDRINEILAQEGGNV